MKVEKMVSDSLKILDHPHVHLVVVAALVLYVANVLPRYSVVVNTLCSHPVVRVLVLLAIMAVACRHTPLAILMAVAYVVSVQGKCMEHMEDMMDEVAGATEQEDEDEGRTQVNRNESAPVNAENFALGDNGEGPRPANRRFNCSAGCADDGSMPTDLSNACSGVGTQGLHCPVVGTTGRPMVGARL